MNYPTIAELTRPKMFSPQQLAEAAQEAQIDGSVCRSYRKYIYISKTGFIALTKGDARRIKHVERLTREAFNHLNHSGLIQQNSSFDQLFRNVKLKKSRAVSRYICGKDRNARLRILHDKVHLATICNQIQDSIYFYDGSPHGKVILMRGLEASSIQALHRYDYQTMSGWDDPARREWQSWIVQATKHRIELEEEIVNRFNQKHEVEKLDHEIHEIVSKNVISTKNLKRLVELQGQFDMLLSHIPKSEHELFTKHFHVQSQIQEAINRIVKRILVDIRLEAWLEYLESNVAEECNPKTIKYYLHDIEEISENLKKWSKVVSHPLLLQGLHDIKRFYKLYQADLLDFQKDRLRDSQHFDPMLFHSVAEKYLKAVDGENYVIYPSLKRKKWSVLNIYSDHQKVESLLVKQTTKGLINKKKQVIASDIDSLLEKYCIKKSVVEKREKDDRIRYWEHLAYMSISSPEKVLKCKTEICCVKQGQKGEFRLYFYSENREIQSYPIQVTSEGIQCNGRIGRNLFVLCEELGFQQIKTPRRNYKNILDYMHRKGFELMHRSGSLCLKLSRARFDELSISLPSSIFMTVEGDIFQQIHSDSGVLSKGYLGQGGVKQTYRMRTIRSRGENYVRSRVKDHIVSTVWMQENQNIYRDLSIQFRNHPSLLVGYFMVYTYEKLRKLPSGSLDVDYKIRFVWLIPEMQYDFHQLTRTQELTFSTKAKGMVQIAKGVQALHHAGYVHHDIKPDNCFVNWSKECPEMIEAKLSDFDLVEKAERDSTERDMPDDIFSLGVTFWEIKHQKNWNYNPFCLSPYQGYTVFKHEHEFEINDEFDKLLFSMIHPDHKKRPSIDQVVKSLREMGYDE